MPSHYLNQCLNIVNWTQGSKFQWYFHQNTTILHWKMAAILSQPQCINTLRPRQNGRHFPSDIFKCIFLFENVWIWIKISLKFVLKVRINNIPALVHIMAWRRIGDKPLSEPMMVNLLMHICVTRPQWVKQSKSNPIQSLHIGGCNNSTWLYPEICLVIF